MKIIFPELTSNQIAKEATSHFQDIEFIPADSLEQATTMLKNGEADSMISGLDHSSRDVLLAYKDHIPLKSPYFSSCFICQKGNQTIAIADGGVNKQPDADKLYCIVRSPGGMYIASYQDGALHKEMDLGFNYNTENWRGHLLRVNNHPDNQAFLQCEDVTTDNPVILTVEGSKIHIWYLEIN